MQTVSYYHLIVGNYRVGPAVLRDFFTELRRRRIWWVAGVYLAVAWLIMQVVGFVEEPLRLPGWADTLAIVLMIAGLPLALVLAWAQETQAGGEGTHRKTEFPELVSDRPSIAVLPLENLSADESWNHLADGMTEELITALAQSSNYFVIARNSTFAYKGTSPDIRQVGRDLGVRYVLEGSIRVINDRIRVTAQLIEAQNGTHVWSSNFDRNLTDIFDIQDEITASIVSSLGKPIYQTETARLRSRPTESLDAWGLLLRARPAGGSSIFSSGVIQTNIALLNRAIELDPNFALAHARLADALAWHINQGHSSDLRKDRVQALEHLRQARMLARTDPEVLATTAGTHAILGDPARSLEIAGELEEIAPNYPGCAQTFGMALTRMGRPAEALLKFGEADRFDPQTQPGPGSFRHALKAQCYLMQEDYEAAISACRRASEIAPDYYFPIALQASALGYLGHDEEAIAAFEKGKATFSDLSVNMLRTWFQATYHSPADVEKLIGGLSKAGIE